ncbi:unnamed protein product [Closterium sp. Naga37s-1]|nr:unnamed protein product [Closterium sp. Naga37s-1]
MGSAPPDLLVQHALGALSSLQGFPGGSFTPPRLLSPRFSGSLHRNFLLENEEIGRGRFGVVRRCRHRASNRPFVCKSISKSSLQSAQHIDSLRSEVDVLLAVRGLPGVVRVEEVIEEAHAVHVVMEACGHGDLFDYIAHFNGMPEPHATCLFRQIVVAVAGCHGLGIIHRDIKPENIFLSLDPAAPPPPAPAAAQTTFPNACTSASTSAAAVAAPASPAPAAPPVPPTSLLMRLGDFGLALFLHTQPGAEARGRVGSSYYMAPEVVRGGRYGLPADVWSLGVILYIMLSGFVPFWGATSLQTFEAICSGRLDLSSPACVALSPAAKALLRAMLSLDPAARPTAHQVLSHPWLSVNKTAVEAPHKSIVAHPWVSEHEVEFETPQDPLKPDLGKGSVETSPGMKGVRDMGLGKGLVDRGGVLAIDGMGTDCMGVDGVDGDGAGVWGSADVEGAGGTDQDSGPSTSGESEETREKGGVSDDSAFESLDYGLMVGKGENGKAILAGGFMREVREERAVRAVRDDVMAGKQAEKEWMLLPLFSREMARGGRLRSRSRGSRERGTGRGLKALWEREERAPLDADIPTFIPPPGLPPPGIPPPGIPPPVIRSPTWQMGYQPFPALPSTTCPTNPPSDMPSSDIPSPDIPPPDMPAPTWQQWRYQPFQARRFPDYPPNRPVPLSNPLACSSSAPHSEVVDLSLSLSLGGGSTTATAATAAPWVSVSRSEMPPGGCSSIAFAAAAAATDIAAAPAATAAVTATAGGAVKRGVWSWGKGGAGLVQAWPDLPADEGGASACAERRSSDDGESCGEGRERKRARRVVWDTCGFTGESVPPPVCVVEGWMVQEEEREGKILRKEEEEVREKGESGDGEKRKGGDWEKGQREEENETGCQQGKEIFEELLQQQQQQQEQQLQQKQQQQQQQQWRVTKWGTDGRKAGVSLGPESTAHGKKRPRGQAAASGREQVVLSASGKPVLSSRGEAELKLKGEGVPSASGDADVMKGSFGRRMRGLLDARPTGGSENEASMGGAKRRRVDGRGTTSAADLGYRPPSHSPARLLPPRPAAAALPTAFESPQEKPLSPACLFPPRAAAVGGGE